MPERARYRRVHGGAGTRASALRSLDPFSDPCMVVSPAPALSDHREEWVKVEGFPEVPGEHLVGVGWEVLLSRRWHNGQAVHEGRARTAVAALFVDAGSAGGPGRGVRRLRIGDNLGALALERKSARSFGLLIHARRLAALEFAKG